MTWQIALITPAFGLLTAFVTAYFARKQRKPDQHTADWSAFTQEMREWTQKQLEYRDKRTADQLADRDAKISEIRSELEEFKIRHTTLRGRYWSLVDWSRYLYALARECRGEDSVKPPPTDVAEDVT